MHRDHLFLKPRQETSAFEFNTAVAQVFEDMIKRSVPGYQHILSILGLLARDLQQGRCYDLGCSLGAGCLMIAENIQNQQMPIIGVDNAPAMLEKARLNTQQHANIELVCADIEKIQIKNAELIAMNFTLQFIALEKRLALLKKIRQGMNQGGQLLLSEKITFDNPKIDQFQQQLHHQFKRENGYSDLEISAKRAALENVLISETLQTHQQRLIDAGFKSVIVWFQCFNFISLIATA